MQNAQNWSPSLIKFYNGNFIVNQSYVGVGSLHVFYTQWKSYYPIFKEYIQGSLLDLGCGIVPYYESYKDLITSNYCVDWSENPFIDLKADLNSTIALNQNFDSILLSDVINHIYNTDTLMSEIYRLLKPNGTVIITTPFLYSINGAPYDYYRFTKYGLLKLAETHNFKVEKLIEYGNVADVIFDFLNKILHNKSGLLLKFASYFSKTSLYKRLNKYDQFSQGYILVLKK